VNWYLAGTRTDTPPYELHVMLSAVVRGLQGQKGSELSCELKFGWDKNWHTSLQTTRIVVCSRPWASRPKRVRVIVFRPCMLLSAGLRALQGKRQLEALVIQVKVGWSLPCPTYSIQAVPWSSAAILVLTVGFNVLKQLTKTAHGQSTWEMNGVFEINYGWWSICRLLLVSYHS